MKVTIPICPNHEGSILSLTTIEIDNKCPKCGSERGVKRWKGFSYDGSRRIIVDCWENACGHIDKYTDVIREFKEKKKTNTKDRRN